MSEQYMQALPIIERAVQHAERRAFFGRGGNHSYADLLRRSEAVAVGLLDGLDDLQEERIAFLVPTGIEYAAVQWGIWLAGGIAVPINGGATVLEIEHVMVTAGVRRLVVAPDLIAVVDDLPARLGLSVLHPDTLAGGGSLPSLDRSRRAMILFTSGTTSKPKGVVFTHAMIEAQARTLVDAWRWQADDRIPLFLPMHHLHGIMNVLTCALWAGASMEPFTKFDADTVCGRVAGGAYSVFMAVPTVYSRLVSWLDKHASTPAADNTVAGFGAMRLMVSGSAALPASVHADWARRTGQTLLERYGMTEIGMALSNPYEGERRAGSVGMPLPGVDLCLVSEVGEQVDSEGAVGEIWVKGDTVFSEYWNNPAATSESFEKGWFKTGDIATLERGYYRIMGRSSVDIIKSGGYKLSALEIEAALLDHPAIAECAIVGLPDDEWGEQVAAAIVVRGNSEMRLQDLKTWASERISAYKLPRALMCVESLPRNAMGKITKPDVKALFLNKGQT